MTIYERLRHTPQAQLYEDSEWLMIETLLLPAYDAYLNRSHSAALAAEIRQMLSLLNATQPDRLRNRVRIDRGPGPVAATPAAGAADVLELMRGTRDPIDFRARMSAQK